ncbi:MAG: lactate racemase domain-containing protein [Planctomycetota bacterium]
MAVGLGYEDRYLTEDEARETIARGLAQEKWDGKKVVALIPDHTRSGPIGMVIKMVYDAIGKQCKLFDCLVALGTHPPMPEDKILERCELTRKEWRTKYKKMRFFNHHWDKPETFAEVGKFTEDMIEEISEGRMREEVPVAVNKMVLDYDAILIIGPTFPHEVVGFSGGNKYIFPGISGKQLIDAFHWLGAVITNPKINGTKWTPVRKVVDTAAAMVPVQRFCVSIVAHFGKLSGVYIGSPEDAWSDAADLSDKLHIVYKEKPYKQVLSMSPEMYDDVWTAGKCMYKLEPVVADGGELIIYAPHIDEISYTHGKIIDEIGYHTIEYFLAQWGRFKGYPRGVTAHSTHVKGIGAYANGVEKPRVNVTLATRIPKARCKRVNLGYRDPATINPADYENREGEGVLCVHKAGEMLHRLTHPPAWARFGG